MPATRHPQLQCLVVRHTVGGRAGCWLSLGPSPRPLVLHVSQVHWLRLVLDEGHTLGALAATNKMTCAVNLRAERRCALISII